MAIANSGQRLRTKEKSIHELHKSAVRFVYPHQVLYTSSQVEHSKKEIDHRIKKENDDQEFCTLHAQQRMVQTDPLPNRDSGLAQICRTIRVDQSASFNTAVRPEARVIDISYSVSVM